MTKTFNDKTLFSPDRVGLVIDYRDLDNDFGNARGRFMSKAYKVVRRRENRPITQSKIIIWQPILEKEPLF
ncbi:MAG: hypothetical protein JRJ86_01810 [Deltaproteobacteria bacterium]|nr:hypothetical protein [Deltaproteobacteria bacterium]